MTTSIAGLPVRPSQSSLMLFQRYQMDQQLIANRVAASVAAMWNAMVDPANFSDSWRRLAPVVNGIIDMHYQMSAADASQYYGLSRAVGGYSGTTVPGTYLDNGYLSHVVNVMGNGQFYHFLKENEAVDASVMARDALCGSAVRLVMNGGRDTVTRAAYHDPVAMGWERIIEPRSCGYCSRLAASSGVHKTAEDKFHAHDDCLCLARVVFNGQSTANEALASEWQKATSGRTGRSAIAAWNQYWSEKNGIGSSQHEVGGPQDEATPSAEGAGNAAFAA